MPRAPPFVATAATASHLRLRGRHLHGANRSKEPWYRVLRTWRRGSFLLPTCFNRSTFPGVCAPEETRDVSISSLTPVATGTTVVFDSNPAIRFQRAVDAQLAVNDLERRVRRLARQLTPALPAQSCPARRSVRSAWWLSA